MTILTDDQLNVVIKELIEALPNNWTATVPQWHLIQDRLKNHLRKALADIPDPPPVPDERLKGNEHYKERHPDLNLHKIVLVVDDNGEPYQLELYGRRMRGELAWILGRRTPNTLFLIRSALDD